MTALLVALGLLMVYSASITSRPSDAGSAYLVRHLVALGVGTIVAVGAAALPRRFWFAAAGPLFVLSCFCLLAVLLPGLGTRVNGAQRWFRFGPVGFQPSELAKLALVLWLARLLVKPGARGHGFDGWLAQPCDAGRLRSRLGFGRGVLAWRPRPLGIALLGIAVVCILVFLEPDFGTAIFLGMVGLMMLFLGGVSLLRLALVGALAVPAVGLLIWHESYRLERITGYVKAWSSFDAAPYHVRQSLLTLGSGGVWGRGLGKGWQKLSFLPEANTDFVFAVIGEELGLVGTLSVVALWIVLLVAGLRALRAVASDPFASLAGFGLVGVLVSQAAINMAVVTALVPPKGIPLPLVSYGGTSLVVSLVAIGMLLGLTRTATASLPAGLRLDRARPDVATAARRPATPRKIPGPAGRLP
ncbi:MAG: FtsW/RodA/SpoVE family cell cycle protein [Pirellulales bacterium]